MTLSHRLAQLKWHRLGRILAGLFAVCLVSPAIGVIEIGYGNNPTRDDHWPAGSVEMANLKTRCAMWVGPPYGGGESHFMYRGDTTSFQQALDAFAKIESPARLLRIHDGGAIEIAFLKDTRDPASDDHFDWSFTVWNPLNWNSLYNDPTNLFAAEISSNRFHQPIDPPTLDVYAGGDQGIDFSKVKVPAGVTVTDERADANGFTGGSFIVGDAFDMTTSKPVPGAKIALAHEKAWKEWDEIANGVADDKGHFQLKSELKGSFGVIVSAQGYAARELDYVQLRGNTLKRFIAYLSPVAKVTGTASDTRGKPVAGLTVRADAVTGIDGRGYDLPQQTQATTDEHGAFTLTGLPKGYLQLFTGGDHYFGLNTFKIYSVPDHDLVISVTATGAIKGRVLDSAGHPVTHGNVDIEPPGNRVGKWSGGSDTAADGSFHFDSVPPGQYTVTAMATNPGPALKADDPDARTITVKPGETVEIDVQGR